MTQIGVISDTHSFVDEKILNYLKDCNQIWFAGDVGSTEILDKLSRMAELKAVYGNIDGQAVRIRVPENNIFHVEKKKVLITHIAGYPNRYNSRVKALIQTEKPDIVVAGHSHILRIIYDKKLNHLHLNPGAAGKSGFHTKRTLLKFKINGDKIEDMKIIEMDR